MHYKQCPKCGTPAYLQAPQCEQCGHVYRTQFTPPEDRTQMYHAPEDPTQMYQAPPAGASDWIQAQPGSHPVLLITLIAFLCLPEAAVALNRQYVKALTLFMGWMSVTLLFLIAAALTGGALLLVYAPLLLMQRVVIAIDAFCIANRLSRGQAVRQWQFF